MALHVAAVLRRGFVFGRALGCQGLVVSDERVVEGRGEGEG